MASWKSVNTRTDSGSVRRVGVGSCYWEAAEGAATANSQVEIAQQLRFSTASKISVPWADSRGPLVAHFLGVH